MSKDFLLYRHLPLHSPFLAIDHTEPPVDVDYKRGLAYSLHKKVTLVKGAPKTIVFYLNADINTTTGQVEYDTPIVREEITFVRDGLGLAVAKYTKVYYMRENGEWSTEFKLIKKYPTGSEQLDEAERRRRNVINQLKVDTITDVAMTEQISPIDSANLGRVFLSAYKLQIIDYIEEGTADFVALVADADAEIFPWIDNPVPYKGDQTIRQLMIEVLS